MKMIVEQTFRYPKRMIWRPEERRFVESGRNSLLYDRGFFYPYGWIKESGTPPDPHCDCILMSQRDCELGDEIDIRIIGVFLRADGDHKYVVVEKQRAVEELAELTEEERRALYRLYPRIGEGEGWFGRERAQECYERGERAL